jgi:hypothetical protein
MWMICLGVCRFRLELGRPSWSLKQIQETNSIPLTLHVFFKMLKSCFCQKP